MKTALKSVALATAAFMFPASTAAETPPNPFGLADQQEFCSAFLVNGFSALKETAVRYGVKLEDVYHLIRC